MNRDEAIKIICEKKVMELSKEKREELLLNWWGIDNEDPEFTRLPEKLQQEILESDEPITVATDLRYNPLLIEVLKYDFIGVKNEYLSEVLSKMIFEEVEVGGKEEILFACPCCLYQTIKERGQYKICPVCFWEDDGSNDPNLYSSVNHMTLSEGKTNFKKYACVAEISKKLVNPDVKKRYLRNEY